MAPTVSHGLQSSSIYWETGHRTWVSFLQPFCHKFTWKLIDDKLRSLMRFPLAHQYLNYIFYDNACYLRYDHGDADCQTPVCPHTTLEILNRSNLTHKVRKKTGHSHLNVTPSQQSSITGNYTAMSLASDEHSKKHVETNMNLKILIWGAETSADLQDFSQTVTENESEDTQPSVLPHSDANGLAETVENKKSQPDSLHIVLNWEMPPLRHGQSAHHQRNGKSEDPSDWFNYGFTATTFEQWIEWQLLVRHNRAKKWIESQKNT